MLSRRSRAKTFLEKYNTDFHVHKKTAIALKALLNELLSDPSFEIHLIDSRAKDIRSTRMKLYEKSYANPERELTDSIAARIITYYSKDVGRVADKLRELLLIDPRKSEDKSELLKLKEFGYKSVHLQAQTKGSWASNPKYAYLRGKSFEIQVRSILEHAWAEIEHEVVYKSEIRYPEEVRRKFARLAGTLEILEDEFLHLRNTRNELIEGHKTDFENRTQGRQSLDSARMIALFEVEKPDSKGWRQAMQDGRPFEEKSDALCVKALRRARIKSPDKLRKVLRSAKFRSATRRVSETGEEITHYSQALIAIAVTSKRVLGDYFPSSRIEQMLKR
jgi:ppGpp synthetase/RelA/SpoT-type nucleotidyltranferase